MGMKVEDRVQYWRGKFYLQCRNDGGGEVGWIKKQRKRGRE